LSALGNPRIFATVTRLFAAVDQWHYDARLTSGRYRGSLNNLQLLAALRARQINPRQFNIKEEITMLTVSTGDLSRKCSTIFTRLFLVTLAAFMLLSVAQAQLSGTNVVLDNPGDLNFNQLLGISDGRVIVGYFGDGSIVPNNGYVLVPKNHYSVENFNHLPSGDFASETQAIGIDNTDLVDIVGFYTDNATGFTHGFLDAYGSKSTVDDPAGLPPYVTTPAQNLLGINDSGKAAGFWTDNSGNEHGFVVKLDFGSPSKSSFVEIPPSTFAGAVATQASNITDNDNVCGFWMDSSGNNHGFFGHVGGTYHTFNVEIDGAAATSTSPFGCNNNGEIVGTFTDSSGNVHGFIYASGAYYQFDYPGSSQTAAFGVSGTLINGVNDRGDFVGFFSTGSQVRGFAHFAD
jgi:probable HAF family extracellular repeat protein